MDCDWEDVPGTLGAKGKRRVKCRRPGCRIVSGRTARPYERIHSECEVSSDAPSVHGVGWHLTQLLKQLGAKPDSSCNCAAKAAEYDRAGLEWCKAHREEMAAFLREKYSSLSWTDLTAFTARAVASGLVWEIGFSDPATALVEMAIRRAESQPRV